MRASRLPRAGLDPDPGGGERGGEGLIECPIKIDEAADDVGVHIRRLYRRRRPAAGSLETRAGLFQPGAQGGRSRDSARRGEWGRSAHGAPPTSGARHLPEQGFPHRRLPRDGRRRAVTGGPGAGRKAAHETGAHALRRSDGERADAPVPLSGELHLLPRRFAHAQELHRRRARRLARLPERVRSVPAGCQPVGVAGIRRAPDRQSGTADPGRNLERVPAGLPRGVCAALLGRAER